jgi:methionyl aminopeptidase
LQDGDVVSFDLGATYEGAIGDTAITCIYGEPKSEEHIRLVKATEEALTSAISKIKVGDRLGIIGNAISKCANKYGLSVITSYGGHGICASEDGKGIPHAQPFISNKDHAGNGIRLQSGMVLAIEPLFVIGRSTNTRTLNDNWTVICDNICSHHEHSMYIHDDHVERL